MLTDFLPKLVEQLTEHTSTTLVKSIQRQAIATPLSQSQIATAYARKGSGGVPILLLHGFDSSLLEFRRLFPLLAAQNETWIVDLLGFGFTDRVAGIPFNPESIKLHLYHFWQTLIQQPVILIGASMGGAAAIDFTLTYPEVVKKLVLIDSAGITGGSVISKYLFPPLDDLATRFLGHPYIRTSISRAAYKNKDLANDDAQLCASLHLQMDRWSQALITFAKSGGYGSFEHQLPQIKQPTLILWGKHDRILGINHALKFKRLLFDSKLIWIEDCGHVPHLEQPSITAQHILAFK